MLEVKVAALAGVTLLHVSGRIDSSSAPDLGALFENLQQDGQYRLIVEMSDVEYINSAGLRELVEALKLCKKEGGNVRILTPSEKVYDVLDLSGLTTIFDIYRNEADAVASF